LFLISKGSESLHTYLDSDFAILAHVVECEPEPVTEANPETQLSASNFEASSSDLLTAAKSVSQDAYDELKLKFDNLMRDFEASRSNFEAMEKIVNDRDRQARGDRRQIEHFEQECRRQRMDIKELQIKLNEMEI
jgi:hypothetical protein